MNRSTYSHSLEETWTNKITSMGVSSSSLCRHCFLSVYQCFKIHVQALELAALTILTVLLLMKYSPISTLVSCWISSSCSPSWVVIEIKGEDAGDGEFPDIVGKRHPPPAWSNITDHEPRRNNSRRRPYANTALELKDIYIYIQICWPLNTCTLWCPLISHCCQQKLRDFTPSPKRPLLLVNAVRWWNKYFSTLEMEVADSQGVCSTCSFSWSGELLGPNPTILHTYFLRHSWWKEHGKMMIHHWILRCLDVFWGHKGGGSHSRQTTSTIPIAGAPCWPMATNINSNTCKLSCAWETHCNFLAPHSDIFWLPISWGLWMPIAP